MEGGIWLRSLRSGSEKHTATLRDAFAPFVGSARRAGGGPVVARQKASARSGRRHAETAAIREWANANGHEVSARGRIPSTAKTLLERTNTPLLDIACCCGFADQSHITREFRKRVGVTPGRYRASSR
jgi:AraC-like DNA-binding protein